MPGSGVGRLSNVPPGTRPVAVAKRSNHEPFALFLG
jgi:hypothetical protein